MADKKVKNESATPFEQEALSKYYMITHLKEDFNSYLKIFHILAALFQMHLHYQNV